MHIDQKPIVKRLIVVVPLFVATFILLQINFDIIWRYFAWSNQTLSVFTFWALTVYLYNEKRNYWITLLPALFMTAVCSAYIMIAPEGFGLPLYIGYITAAIVCIFLLFLFIRFTRNRK